MKTILDAMRDALARGHRIEIRGFGSFSINRRPPRIGRNPRSGEKVVHSRKARAALQAGQGAARGGRRSRVGAERGEPSAAAEPHARSPPAD